MLTSFADHRISWLFDTFLHSFSFVIFKVFQLSTAEDTDNGICVLVIPIFMLQICPIYVLYTTLCLDLENITEIVLDIILFGDKMQNNSLILSSFVCV